MTWNALFSRERIITCDITISTSFNNASTHPIFIFYFFCCDRVSRYDLEQFLDVRIDLGRNLLLGFPVQQAERFEYLGRGFIECPEKCTEAAARLIRILCCGKGRENLGFEVTFLHLVDVTVDHHLNGPIDVILHRRRPEKDDIVVLDDFGRINIIQINYLDRLELAMILKFILQRGGNFA